MRNFSILLVDDIPDNIHALTLIIEENFDIDIYSSNSAKEAIAILMQNPIDLILSDIQMPDIDGFQMVEYLKGIESLKEIPVIFITGIYDKDEYKKRGYSLGAIEYIDKPIDDVLLCAKLKVYIDLFNKNKVQAQAIEESNEVFIHQSKLATMGEMLGVIAHQLKQPLNTMSLYCSDIKEAYAYNEINEEFVDTFDKNTKEQIEFMNETINGFLDFFKPDKVKTHFTLKECVDKTTQLLMKQMQSNDINLSVSIGDEIIYGVMTELQQVLLNLVTNAKDAFIEKNINNRSIHITSMHKDKQIYIFVEDNAGGIPNENLEKIFDPYFTTKKHGTGTGLYMVKLVIQSSFGGQLQIQNSHQGAKFIITLPT